MSAPQRNERHLRESDEKFNQLADNITDAFWIRSPDMSELHYISPAFERIWGRSMASLYANPHQWSEYIFPEDRDRVLRAFDTLKAEVPSLDIEYRIVRPDNDIRWVSVRAYQVRDAAGGLIRQTGIVSDITERRRVETALLESEGRYRALVDWSPESIAVTRQGKILFVNPAAVKMMAATSDHELIGKPMLEFVHPDFHQVVIERMKHTAEVGGSLPLLEEKLLKVDGTVMDVEIQGASIVYDGQPAVFSSLRDVTETKRAAEALRASMDEFSRVNRALKMLSSCNEALIREEQETALLQKICAIAVDHGDYRMAWVGYAQDDQARSITPLAHAGAEDGYLSAIEVTWKEDAPSGQGPAGQAIRTGQAVVFEDVTLAPAFQPWLALALKHGYRGVTCLPLRDANSRIWPADTLFRADQADQRRGAQAAAGPRR